MRAILAATVAFLPSLLMADVLHMADGTTREGRIVETTEKEIVVDFGKGSVSLVVRLPRADVASIEPKAGGADTLTAEYMARLAKAIAGTADDWCALGDWCVRQRCLNDKARDAFDRAMALDPNHAGAHAALGHVKLNDAWMPRDQAIRLLAPDLVAEGGAKARELAARKEAEEAKTQALEAQKLVEVLQGRVALLIKESDDLRQRLAQPPPPPPDYYRPRVIYRPIYIFTDPRGQTPRKDGDSRPPTNRDGDRPRRTLPAPEPNALPADPRPPGTK